MLQAAPGCAFLFLVAQRPGAPEHGVSRDTVRSSPKIQRLTGLAACLLAAYLCGYWAVRATHTKRWFDKSTDETGSYTFFDTWSPSDTILYRAFYPVLVLDLVVLKRQFERDKW
jgi:hypothetical protein